MTFEKLDAAGIQLHAIVAMASNRVIGKDGDLPWHLSEDLKLFKERTLGHPIIMGRTTFESLPKQRPLPRRRNIVLSRTIAPREGLEIITDLDQLIELGVTGDAYLIGGARVFESYLSACASIILTYVHEPHDGDTFMPPFEDRFAFTETLATFPEFEVRRYRRGEES
ncbi:MAG: dihydrofolate reductase [Verrucomicrobiales bacterium]|jgi:dihydrofolate reductase